jgi:hypothetical protein
MGFEIVMVSEDTLGWVLPLMKMVPPLVTLVTPSPSVL